MRPHPHLYEISTWPWLERLSAREQRTVTLGSVPPAEWSRLRDLGFDAVYLMGIWRRSATGRLIARTDPPLLRAYDNVLPGWSMRDVPGSPYSVQAYEPDPRIGGWADVATARAQLAARGMKLFLDFVPNHTGLDHAWIAAHPDFYVQGTLDDYRRAPELFHPMDVEGQVTFIAYGRDPYFPPWRDVAQLNYFNPATREAMIAGLQRLAEHCDGVRCDMAMLLVNEIFARTWGTIVDLLWPVPADEFWPAAISRVRGLTYLAEVYWDREWQLQQQGFDYTYDKRLLDRLHHSPSEEVRAHLTADLEYSRRLARFLENHDETRSASVFGDRLPAAATIAYTLPGMRFVFDGQLEGVRTSVPVQLGRWPEDAADPRVEHLYSRILGAASLPLMHDGTWRLLEARSAGDPTASNIVAFEWRLDSERAVIAANLATVQSQALLQLDDLPDAAAVDFIDQLTDERLRWALDDLRDGLYVRLGPGAAHLFLLETVP